MKIARIGSEERQYWALMNVEDWTAREIAGSISEWGPSLCHGGSASASLPVIGDAVALADVRLLAPVENSAKIVAIGINYKSHLDELGWSVPPGPLAFLKPLSCLAGPNDEIEYPEITSQLDYEIEMVAVVGCREIHDRTHGSGCILGYTIGNDVTARDVQFREVGGSTTVDFFSSKTMDRTASIGPWITTCDEVGEVPDLAMSLSVNGERRQGGRTSEMIWGPDEIVAYADRHTALGSGDLIFTGTPSGVALASGNYLEVGDVLELTIDRLGRLESRVAASRDATGVR